MAEWQLEHAVTLGLEPSLKGDSSGFCDIGDYPISLLREEYRDIGYTPNDRVRLHRGVKKASKDSTTSKSQIAGTGLARLMLWTSH